MFQKQSSCTLLTASLSFSEHSSVINHFSFLLTLSILCYSCVCVHINMCPANSMILGCHLNFRSFFLSNVNNISKGEILFGTKMIILGRTNNKYCFYVFLCNMTLLFTNKSSIAAMELRIQVNNKFMRISVIDPFLAAKKHESCLLSIPYLASKLKYI